MARNRILPTLIVGLIGAVIGSFVMMLYANTHVFGAAGPGSTPPAFAAMPLSGVSDQDRIVSAVKRTKSSVVAITEQINGQQYIPTDPFFQQFFGQQGPGFVQPYKAEASGSGFVVDDQGDIVTNAHVVQPPEQPNARISNLTVVFANGDKVPAHVVAANVGADVALIKVDNYRKLPPPLSLADSDRLEQGQWAIAIGEPLELQQTVTVGVVSGFDRQEPIPTENGSEINFKGLLQTSAPINPGNSGGPLIDIDGQVIGVNQSTVKSAYAQGIGFAIPSNTVKRVVADLMAHPGIHQGTDTGFLGILMQQLNAGFKNQTGYQGDAGIGVREVVSGSPADQAGISPGDVIVQVDGKTFNDLKSLHDYIGSKKPGDTIRLNLWSQGMKKFVAVKLGETPAAQPMTQGQQQPEQQAPPEDQQQPEQP
ncbi:MAG: trypsin-like peptidase domain-containing protein [Candidatus Eremiobacteraeota bacterium]|nr:trypsin-like peptidase domain-containing protein [Candidatus Eremiobacteraeota bacterium]